MLIYYIWSKMCLPPRRTKDPQPSFFCWGRVAQYLVFYILFCKLLFVIYSFYVCFFFYAIMISFCSLHSCLSLNVHIFVSPASLFPKYKKCSYLRSNSVLSKQLHHSRNTILANDNYN